MIKVSERGIKMDYSVPKNFYEFQYGWYRDIDLHYEAEQLLKVLDSAQKKMIYNAILRKTKNGLFQLQSLKIMTLVIMRHISA